MGKSVENIVFVCMASYKLVQKRRDPLQNLKLHRLEK